VRLKPTLPVSLAVPAREPLWAAVVEDGDDGLLLALRSRPATPIGLFDGEPALVQADTPRGVYRRRGVLRVITAISGGERDDVVRFVPEEEIDLVQRRESVRADAEVLVAITSEERPGQRREGQALNLSGNGALLAGVEGLVAGEPVELVLSLPGHEPAIEAGGRVARVTPEGLLAVAFERIRPADRDRVIRFVFERHRIALRSTRDG
jgi:hypothetical protein